MWAVSDANVWVSEQAIPPAFGSGLLMATVEAFTIQFQEDGANKAKMMLAWDQTVVEVPISYE